MVLILASASPIRSAMLAQAGVEHKVVPAAIDEDAVKRLGRKPQETAKRLAQAKALAVSSAHPANWVVGSDSLVFVDGRRFGKPGSREEAANHLRFFSGRALELTSGVALAKDGEVHWSFADTALLQVRPLSDQFIQDYLDAEWPAVGGCVGVFRMEGPGVQLFERVEGSHFTILGMPLIPLLAALRDRGLIAS